MSYFSYASLDGPSLPERNESRRLSTKKSPISRNDKVEYKRAAPKNSVSIPRKAIKSKVENFQEFITVFKEILYF